MSFGNVVFLLFDDFANLLFPTACAACGIGLQREEEVICLSCEQDLPETDFHEVEGNPAAKQFWGRVKLENVCSMYLFSKRSRVQNIIHQLKYRGRTEIGIILGNRYGTRLRFHRMYKSIDLVVPVPLHKAKEKRRGYNQSACFGEGMADGLAVPFSPNLLKRIEDTETQTRKDRFSRWKNVEELFLLDEIDENLDSLKGKHVLLVDDVLTTGATLEACAHILLDAGVEKLSIATLAYAVR